MDYFFLNYSGGQLKKNTFRKANAIACTWAEMLTAIENETEENLCCDIQVGSPEHLEYQALADNHFNPSTR